MSFKKRSTSILTTTWTEQKMLVHVGFKILSLFIAFMLFYYPYQYISASNYQSALIEATNVKIQRMVVENVPDVVHRAQIAIEFFF